MSKNPYFQDLAKATIERDGEYFDALTFNHSIYGRGFELLFGSFDIYDDFVRGLRGRKISKFNLIKKIAGSDVTEKIEIVAEMLSHNSDFYKASYIIR